MYVLIKALPQVLYVKSYLRVFVCMCRYIILFSDKINPSTAKKQYSLLTTVGYEIADKLSSRVSLLYMQSTGSP